MADHVIKTGDLIEITISAPAIVPLLQAPIPLTGSSTSLLITGFPVCLLGDELPKELRGPLPYTAPPFVIPGMGTLKLTILPQNMTQLTMNSGKPLLIVGGQFPAMFTVEEPAMQPTPTGPIPDPQIEKPGAARFITTNEVVVAG
jgi:Contractile injection system spike tip protein